MTVALLFALSSLFWPLITSVPAVATAPILILVGLGMLSGLTDLKNLSAREQIIPLLMVLITVMTGDFMISLALGLLLFTFLAITSRRWQDITVMLLTLDGVFVTYLVLSSRMG